MSSLYQNGARWLMGIFYFAAGVNHFVNPGFYTGIIPPYLPDPLMLVYVSGVAELLLGAGVCIERTRRISAWLIVAMLIAFMPVHLHMLMHSEQFAGVSLWMLVARIPLQGLLLYWAYRYTRPAQTVRL